MKIAVIGLNAMGSYFAVKLGKRNEVIGIDTRIEKVNAINENGVVIEEDGETATYAYNAKLAGTVDEKVDVALLFVKSTQLANALAIDSNILRDDTLIISFQNGLGNERDILKFVEPDNVVLAATEIACYNKENRIIFSGNKLTHVASLNQNQKTNMKVKLLFDQIGLECELENDLNKMIWNKLMVNITLNPLCAIFNCKIKVVYENKYLWEIAKDIVYEACEIAKLEGVNLDYEEELEYIRKRVYSIAKAYPSMHRDVEKRRFTEIDKLNGAIVKIAYKNGYKVPNNAFVVNAIKAIEKLYS